MKKLKKQGTLTICFALLLLADFSPAALPSAAQTPTRTFPETGHTVRGLFLQYWETHGGLAQQGYPLTEELQEVSDINGKPYTVQYFERAVFELHPENAGTPYEILLSLLGKERYLEQYGPGGAPNQQASTDGPRIFPETGFTVGGAFRRYWEQHGGLAQQGYPISNEFQEANPFNGKPYTVQYFERAVFEYHPENAGTPYEVLLTQLGTLQHQAKHTTLSIPGPSAPGLLQRNPRGSDTYLLWDEGKIVYSDFVGPQFVLTATLALDIHSGKLITITAAPNITVSNTSISGSILVGLGPVKDPNCPTCGIDVVGEDLNTGAAFTVMPGVSNVYRDPPVISGNTVAWIEGDAKGERIITRDLDIGSTSTIISQPTSHSGSISSLLINSQYMAWVESSFANGVLFNSIKTYSFKTRQTQTAVRTSNSRGDPLYVALSESYLAWADPFPHILDLFTGQVKLLSEERAFRPVMRGDTLLWVSPGYGIWGMKLSNGKPLLLIGPSTPYKWLAIAGDWLVWEESGKGHLTTLSLPQVFDNPKPLPSTPTPPAPPSGSRLIIDNLYHAPLGAGNYLFWLGPGSSNRLYGYSLDKGKSVVVGESREQKLALASDGHDLVWVESLLSGLYRVRHLDLQTSQLSTVLQGSDPDENYSVNHAQADEPFPSTFAVDSGVLYYRGTSSAHKGLWARTLRNGQEQLISPDGAGPVAANGRLLWTDHNGVEYNLYLRIAGDSNESILLANSKQEGGSIGNYGVSGDYAVWHIQGKGIYLYNILRNTRSILAAYNKYPNGIIYHPLISGDWVVWTDEATPPNTVYWFIKAYNIANGVTSTVLQVEGRTPVEAWAIIGGRSIAYKMGDKVYLADLP